MSILSRTKILGAKVESTRGTAVTPVDADAGFNIYNAQFQRILPFDQRPSQVGLGQIKATPGSKAARVTFETDLVGAGATGVPAWASVFLPACGMALTGSTYSFDVTVLTTLSISLYHGTFLQKIAGAVGTFKINLFSGRAGRIAFDFIGKLVDESNATALVPTLPTVVPPRFASGTCNLNSGAQAVSQLTLDAGNDVQLVESPQDTSDTGWAFAEVRDRIPMLDMDPLLVIIGTQNYNTLLESSTEVALSIVLNGSTNNTITIASSTAQVIELQTSERNKSEVRNVKCQFNGSSPFTIAFS
jgi:hypothetical protein